MFGWNFSRRGGCCCLLHVSCSLDVVHHLSLFCLPVPSTALARFVMNLCCWLDRQNKATCSWLLPPFTLAVQPGSRRNLTTNCPAALWRLLSKLSYAYWVIIMSVSVGSELLFLSALRILCYVFIFSSVGEAIRLPHLPIWCSED